MIMPRKPTDLTGKRFGMLVVTGISDQRTGYGRRYYECRCDCGNTHRATYGDLKSGKVTSCGCKLQNPMIDLTGQRYSRLVAVRYIGGSKWLWRCDCGKTIIAAASKVKNGRTISCGCARAENVRKLYVAGTAPCKIKPETRGKLRVTNSSGVTGVYWDKSRGKWCATITFKHKKYHLGRYAKLEDAASARKTAESMIFDEFLDWYKEYCKTAKK